MRVIIYLKLNSIKKLWKFHEVDIPNPEWQEMTSTEDFKGFAIVNPLYTNVLTVPNREESGLKIYQANVIKLSRYKLDDNITFAVCTLDETTKPFSTTSQTTLPI